MMRWEKVAGHGGGGPGKRWGHTCNAVQGGRLLYVFGGYGIDNRHTNKVHVFDTVNRIWSEPVMMGTLPSPRDSHSCTTLGKYLIVFGGTNGREPLNDLHILDTYTLVWKHLAPSGTPPSKRETHACSSWNNKMIIIGGEDTNHNYLSDVHVLDTDTLAWCKLNTTGQIFPPRAGHTTISLGKNLFIFGGFANDQSLCDDVYVLDVAAGTWSKVMPTGEGPSARSSVAGDCLDPHLGGALVFVGGCDKNLEPLEDMYYLYTGQVYHRILRTTPHYFPLNFTYSCYDIHLELSTYPKIQSPSS
ncbi:protein GLUTELIN PRECURSOR ACCUMULATION 3-like isoform X4 [Lycium barbarum]|uniref:protein GLUTELIN PRECURSOR ACCUMULATION 3-like isoform X4 n=1 Tax=Lycium barbarum TaxID=112863 RepID=UPI00293E8E15|nr:protein GLUTELIN PRECURSOR ACCUMULATION 3-like isoform X4 [Lycium barbarum]